MVSVEVSLSPLFSWGPGIGSLDCSRAQKQHVKLQTYWNALQKCLWVWKKTQLWKELYSPQLVNYPSFEHFMHIYVWVFTWYHRFFSFCVSVPPVWHKLIFTKRTHRHTHTHKHTHAHMHTQSPCSARPLNSVVLKLGATWWRHGGCIELFLFLLILPICKLELSTFDPWCT